MPARSLPPSLTDLEWSAVSLAYMDAMGRGCATFDGDSIFNWVAARLFGRRRPNSIADPKLEAVRHFVCTSRRQGRVEESAIDELAKYGFTPAQINALTTPVI